MNKKIYSEKDKEILEMAIRYKFAYEELFDKLPYWKRTVISSNTGQLNNDRLVAEFSEEVVKYAEAMK